MIILTSLTIASCQKQISEDPLVSKIHVQLDSLLRNPEIESVSCGLIINGERYEIHKGQLLNGKSPTDETVYEIASITKTFTGTLLAHALVERKVKIDDDIRKYLSDSFPELQYEGYPITFQHLVTHQSGLPNMFPEIDGLFDNPDWDTLPYEINRLQRDFSREQFFEALRSIKLDTIPGYRFAYSNAGANLLGYLLEEIYQMSYEEILKEKILLPLGMDETRLGISDQARQNLAIGQNLNRTEMPFRVNKEMSAEGGIISNVDDMLKYLEFHLDRNNEVVTTSHSELWDGQFGDFEAGLFWQIFKNGEKPDKVFQNGGAFGTSSWVTLIPEQGIGVFIVTNVSGPNVHHKLSETVDSLIEILPGMSH
ncbi:MAG: hypothetical protein DHS20C17_20840 [Cyclobacteriaceae bacterium]|nr:MAG: hypothetical protein DHS20C17_20840 [Cyclobacteriaceae bacterium]